MNVGPVLKMTKFFMPEIKTGELPEEAYARLVKNSQPYPLAHPTARLFQVSFILRQENLQQPHVAEVGKEISNWPKCVGAVLAIIETTDLVCIHTLYRGGSQGGTPILVGPTDVIQRVYFDDYPAEPAF